MVLWVPVRSLSWTISVSLWSAWSHSSLLLLSFALWGSLELFCFLFDMQNIKLQLSGVLSPVFPVWHRHLYSSSGSSTNQKHGVVSKMLWRATWCLLRYCFLLCFHLCFSTCGCFDWNFFCFQKTFTQLLWLDRSNSWRKSKRWKTERRNLKRQSVGPSLIILETANNPSIMFWLGNDKKWNQTN